MNWLDLTLIAILAVFTLVGLKTGIIKAVLSLAGLVIGVILAGVVEVGVQVFLADRYGVARSVANVRDPYLTSHEADPVPSVPFHPAGGGVAAPGAIGARGHGIAQWQA